MVWHHSCSLEDKQSKRRKNMDKKILTVVLAGMVFTMALLPAISNAGNGKMGGQGLHTQTNSATRIQDRQQLKDGSCLTPGASSTGAAQQKGKTYGPGDGTGNQGTGPKDGTGNGAPANR
jgi:hypothetical protein